MPASQSTHALFRQGLWKDQRRLETLSCGGVRALVKHYPDRAEAAAELDTLDYLRSHLKTALVPEVLSSSSTSVTLRYIRGIRVFNLFVELDRLDRQLATQGRALKTNILRRCEDNQREIQGILLSRNIVPPPPYLAGEKIVAILSVLDDCLGLDLPWSRLNFELELLDQVWREEARIPFRDATTKNMVLVEPKLWLGHFQDEEARREYLQRELAEGSADAWGVAPLVDFDFASCVASSTPEDDPISFGYHERTWAGPPSGIDELVWSGKPHAARAALTFVLRYLRFGGRKAAYRLLDARGHAVRFRYDDESFYFLHLPEIVRSLWSEADDEIPALLDTSHRLGGALKSLTSAVPAGAGTAYGTRRQYYVDMYPE